MTVSSRARPNGVSLLASGEPMIWLTGGMFATACCMIVCLLLFILSKGLSTHWQRPIAILPMEDNSIVSGELIHEQTATKQLYIRTGNYDIGNRHFAFVPKSKIASSEIFYPRDIWLIERREWGVLYGFPRRLTHQFAPTQDLRFRQLSDFASQLDLQSASTDGDSHKKLKSLIQEKLKSMGLQLQSDFAKTDLSTIDSSLVFQNVAKASSANRVLNQKILTVQRAIARTDEHIGKSRILIRKAELADHIDLQSVAEDALQSATMRGTVEAQFEDTMASIREWELLLSDAPDAYASLNQMRDTLEAAHRETLLTFQEAERMVQATIRNLSAPTRDILNRCILSTLEAAKEQYHLQQEMARLEEVQKACTLELLIPILQSGETAASEVLENKVLQSEMQLSPKLRLLCIGDSSQLPDRWLSVADSSESKKLLRLTSKEILVRDIVRYVEPNRLSLGGRIGLYFDRWVEFLFGEPREAGIEGGFFPALWGTIVMTLIMSLAVMPFGVMAALYMREYAKSGWMLSAIRISINNLAGVPSIVYGVFGLAFFCYTIGGYIDGGPQRAGLQVWTPGVWFFVMGVTASLSLIAFVFAFLGSGSSAHQSIYRKQLGNLSGLFWLLSLGCLIALLAKSPYFHGFYEAALPNPTFGKGCLLWASLTLALLTLPVVIVATEEALAAVPNSLREGSYACGAGKWQTLSRIVLPHARPGIITGFILAMARGAGEVAPMMLVGAIPLATDLPLDGEFPFFHGSRSFMHLGFQIYSLGFQSQNSEAAKPMVFTATLLLLTIVTLLNITAIWLRARLRRRFQSSQF